MAVSSIPAGARLHDGASLDVWRAWIRHLLRTGCFQRRNLSWICLREHWFLKIPRLPGRPPALDDGAAVAAAADEFRLTAQLATLDRAVAPPLRLVDACIVKHRLTGTDLWALASREGATPAVLAALAEGLSLAARLHRRDPAAVPDLVVHDYGRDPYLAAPPRLRERLRRQPPVIVVGGLEVRNFRQAGPAGPWWFFDPHEVMLGAPEDDVSRYLISVLMISWGRHARCMPWTGFELDDLLQPYRAAAARPLDGELLGYMFRRNLARRRVEIGRSIEQMPGLLQLAARTYGSWYFRQLEAWGRRHDL